MASWDMLSGRERLESQLRLDPHYRPIREPYYREKVVVLPPEGERKVRKHKRGM